MPIKYEVRSITGKYTDKNGNEKNSYQTIGKIIQTAKGGFMLKLDSIPVGFDGWAYLNEPQPKEQDKKPATAGGLGDMEDDIPFLFNMNTVCDTIGTPNSLWRSQRGKNGKEMLLLRANKADF